MNNRSVALVVLGVFLTILFPGCLPKVDYQTQSFDIGEASVLSGKQLRFIARDFIVEKRSLTPGYSREIFDQTSLPTDPTNHQHIDFSQSDPFALSLPSSSEFAYFGRLHADLFIGSDGTISFGGQGTGNSDLVGFFLSDQISLLPVDATVEGSATSYALFEDGIIITYQNVNGNTFQCELDLGANQRFNITITYAVVDGNTRAGVVGLADSIGYTRNLNPTESDVLHLLDTYYVESDLLQSTSEW
tara:strand:- start:360 stop:1097 length:738 start_codon:yes stop_codon:yes gene_type:complete